MRVRMLSTHFIERWRERVGGVPTLRLINDLIESSNMIRPTRDIQYFSNGIWVNDRQLSEFWHHGKGVIIRVDGDRELAVTVLTPQHSE